MRLRRTSTTSQSCQRSHCPHRIGSLVRPELPMAPVGSSQAPTAAVDNAALSAARPQSTYRSGEAVQTNEITAKSPWLDAILSVPNA